MEVVEDRIGPQVDEFARAFFERPLETRERRIHRTEADLHEGQGKGIDERRLGEVDPSFEDLLCSAAVSGDRHGVAEVRRGVRGAPGVLHGNKTYLLQDEDGQITEGHSISAGLDYPGIGPEHSWLHDIGRAEYVSITYKEALLGILIGGGSLLLVAWVYSLITKKEGMGGGDIKLLAMMGAIVGWQGVLFTIFVASLVGTLAGLAVMLQSRKGLKLAVPFGPFLSIGSIAYIIFGTPLIDWYFNLLG